MVDVDGDVFDDQDELTLPRSLARLTGGSRIAIGSEVHEPQCWDFGYRTSPAGGGRESG